MGVGVGDGSLVTGSTVVEGVPSALGSVVWAGVCEPLVAEPSVEEGSVVVVGWPVPVGAESLAPVSLEVVVVVVAESVRFNGVTVVLVERVEPVVLGLLAPPDREWPVFTDAGAVP